MSEKSWTSGGQIAEAAEARFEELAHKGWDWSSFYNGFLEGATSSPSGQAKLADERGDSRPVCPAVLADHYRPKQGDVSGLPQRDEE